MSPKIFKRLGTFHDRVIFDCFCRHKHHTDSTKINRPGHNIHMYWTNFWQPSVHVRQNIFENNLIKVCTSHLYASFDTICVQISQLFAARWIFKHSKEFRNRRHFPSSNLSIFKHTSKSHCASKNLPIWAQLVPKEV